MRVRVFAIQCFKIASKVLKKTNDKYTATHLSLKYLIFNHGAQFNEVDYRKQLI